LLSYAKEGGYYITNPYWHEKDEKKEERKRKKKERKEMMNSGFFSCLFLSFRVLKGAFMSIL